MERNLYIANYKKHKDNLCFLSMEKVLYVYNLFKADKKKERFDIILEPLQAMTQLAFLAFYPKQIDSSSKTLQ